MDYNKQTLGCKIKIEFLLLLLFFSSSSNILYAQVCTAKILQNDTTICSGTSLQLTVSINDSSDLCNTYSLTSALQDGLLGWYPFCGNTNDISAAGNNGFATGPISYTADRYNNPNTAINFSGNGESVRTNKIDRTTSNSFSYVTWINTQNTVTLPAETIDPSSGFSTDLATPCVIHASHGFNFNLNNQHTGSGLYIASNGVFVLEHANSIVSTPLSWSGALIGWHSVAVVYENHLPKLYVDGKFVKSGLVTPYIVHPSLGCDSFFINGTYPYITSGFGKGFKPSSVSVPFNNFKGEIDDIKIFNRALTANEIAELYSKDKSSILWSTGETGRTITVTPLKDTSYSVTVTNSLGSCKSSVQIHVKSCPLFSCDQTGISNNDTTVCKGTPFILNAKNALSYEWYPLRGLSDSAIQNPVVNVDSDATYYLKSGFVSENLIPNGDFEQGNSSFTTTYTYCNSGNCLFPLANNGYSIGKDASFFHSLFQGKDHTSGTGNFMIINGADPNLTVWKKTITVLPNTSYAFGVWISTMFINNTARIRFSVNGVQLGPVFNAPQELNKWVQVFTAWNSGNNTSATIEIVDTFNEPNGNDFGLDDIFFGKIVSCTDSIHIKTRITDKVNTKASICQGRNYRLPSGNIVSTTGFYNDTLKNRQGCDSLITTVNLKVINPVLKNESSSICKGQFYTLPSGNVVSSAGIHNDTVRSSLGCDSLITIINLIVSAPLTKGITASICPGKIYTLPSGLIVHKAGLYSDTIRTVNGCDSLITAVGLTIAATQIVDTNVSICSNENYTLPSGLIVNKTGTYSDTVRMQTGCDSLITLVNLKVNEPPAITISKSNDIDCIVGYSKLTATGGIKYNWSPSSSLDNPAVYNPVAAPNSSTIYTVTVTNNGCIARDSIEVKVTEGNADNSYFVASAFTPNNDGKNDCFSIRSWGLVSNLNFSVFDRSGNLVYHTTDPSSCWNGTYKGATLGTATFIYEISATTNCSKIFRKGTVVLIR